MPASPFRRHLAKSARRALPLVLWLLGVGVLVYLVAREGFADVARALAQAGWGLLVVSLFSVVIIVLDARGWQQLLPPGGSRLPLRDLLAPRWICSAINALLPVAQVGGDFVRARLLVQRGVSGPVAGASIVADITIAVASQAVFVVPGVLLLLHYDRGGNVGLALAGAVVGYGAIIVAFYLMQRTGMFLKLVRAFERVIQVGSWQSILGGARALDEAILEVYARRRDLLVSGAWRFLGWVAGTGEVWLALHYLGHPVRLDEAFMIESLIQGIRAAAFLVPGALGVQEAALLILVTAVGLEPQTGLALSLVKRVRELLTGLPALAWWQILEGRRLLRRRAAAAPQTDQPDPAHQR